MNDNKKPLWQFIQIVCCHLWSHEAWVSVLHTGDALVLTHQKEHQVSIRCHVVGVNSAWWITFCLSVSSSWSLTFRASYFASVPAEKPVAASKEWLLFDKNTQLKSPFPLKIGFKMFRMQADGQHFFRDVLFSCGSWRALTHPLETCVHDKIRSAISPLLAVSASETLLTNSLSPFLADPSPFLMT